MFKSLLLSLALLLSFHLCHGQTAVYPKDLSKKCLKKYNQAKQAQREGNTREAIKAYDKVLKKNPELIAAEINLARIAYDQGNKAKAKILFSSIISDYPLYDPKVYLAYGTLLMELEEYETAAQIYQQYLVIDPDHARAKEALNRASKLAKATAHPIAFTPKPLSPLVNTTDLEYEASFTADESSMIFTRLLNNQEDFYQATLVNGIITEVKPITELNTRDNEGAHCISSDGKKLIFTFCDNRRTIGGCDLYSTDLVNDKWSTPVNLGRQLNSEANDSQPTLSGDGQTLYFRSSREGGYGGFDIWKSSKTKDGTWAEAINLGDDINTAGNDETPFLHKDGLTLYFSSDGREGLGNLDLYVAKRAHWNASWSTIEHMPYPINTPAEDSGLKVSLDGKTAYFATDRDDINRRDIYSFALPESLQPHQATYIKILVVDAFNQQGLPATLELTALEGENQQLTGQANNQGELLIAYPADQAMAINISHPDYVFYSDHIAAHEGNTKAEPVIYKINLIPTTKEANHPQNTAIVLNNIFFETGSSILEPRSEIEIDYLYKLLTENPTLRIQILGHTDSIGKDSDNLSLSENRAKAVYQALLKKGISAASLSYIGKGESEPIATNDTPEGRQSNRRTEFIIL